MEYQYLRTSDPPESTNQTSLCASQAPAFVFLLRAWRNIHKHMWAFTSQVSFHGSWMLKKDEALNFQEPYLILSPFKTYWLFYLRGQHTMRALLGKPEKRQNLKEC